MSDEICCVDPEDCDCEVAADPVDVAHALAAHVDYPTAQRLGVQFDKARHGLPAGPRIASGPVEEAQLESKTSAGSGQIEHAVGREGS